MQSFGVSADEEQKLHDLALRWQLGGRRRLPDGCASIWEYMLQRLCYLNDLRRWKGPTWYLAPLALQHPERLAWVFAWGEGNNRTMAQSPRPVDHNDLSQEDLRCTWWPILVDTTFSHLADSPGGNCLPGVCPPQVDNKSQVWWWHISRLLSARGSPLPLPVYPQPEPHPQPPAAATGAHGASSSSSSGAAGSGAHGAHGAPLPGGSDDEAWAFDDGAVVIVETPGPLFEELLDSES